MKIISFKTAKLAKEIGFDLSSPAFYSCDEPSSGRAGNQLVINDWIKVNELNVEKTQESSMIYSAPFQVQLQTWLREKYHIYCIVFPSHNKFCPLIRECGITRIIDKKFDTYEQALEEGLFESLKLFIVLKTEKI